MRSLILVAFCMATLLCQSVVAQTFDEKFEHWPLETRIEGTIVFAPQVFDSSVLSDALAQSDLNRTIEFVIHGADGDCIASEYSTAFADREVNVQTFITVDALCIGLRDVLQDADVCCIHFADSLSTADQAAVLRLEKVLHAFVSRGKILVVIGKPVEMLGGLYETDDGERHVKTLRAGLDLIPDTLIRTASDVGGSDLLLKQLEKSPGTVGIELAGGAVAVLEQRRLQVVGPGTATFEICGNEVLPPRVQTIKEQNSPRQSPADYVIDLTEWRRVAIDRTLPAFPPKTRQVPRLNHGTLLIVGGGSMPDGLMEQMIELAGGVEEARMVYIPCSERSRVSPEQRTVEQWKKMGVTHATFVHTKDRSKANSDEEFLKPLRKATGIWFGGGRQWNLADSYYGTTAHRLMKEVLMRGGVIGGSSAGASIQAQYLARATPIENFRIMAPGYERGGLGFISGVAIDQHFSQRNRQKDMTELVNCYPQLLGIGIDEGTALIVQQSIGQVVGAGDVYFYDRERYFTDDVPDFISLPAGSSYNLATRMVVSVPMLTAAASADNVTGIADTVRQVSAGTVQIDSAGDLSSGVIISANGYILTVAHGLNKTADEVNVRLVDGDTAVANVVSQNRTRDVALLKISDAAKHAFTAIPLAGELAVRETPTLAFGYPAREVPGKSPVVRLGKVIGRDKTSIRSSCVMTAGDSGGPLVTTDGRLLGIHQRIGLGRQSNLHLTIDACCAALADALDLRDIGRVTTTSDQPPIPLTASHEALATWQRRTVRIPNEDGEIIAWGTLINSNTVVTKLSEIASRTTILVRTASDRSITAELIDKNRPLDVAVLRLSAEEETGDPAAGPATHVGVGDLVFGSGEDEVGIIARVGHNEPATKPQLGCTLVTENNALIVEHVAPYSAASDAGLQPGDLLTHLSGKMLKRLSDVASPMARLQPGDHVTFEFERDGVRQSSTGRLCHQPSEMLERSEFLDGRAGELSIRRTDFHGILQHDGPLLARQMGGPLFSEDGRLIGINIARRSREAVLAVPIEKVREIVSGK